MRHRDEKGNGRRHGGKVETDLGVPTIGEEEEVEAIEDDVEGETARLEELALEPVFTHGCDAVELHAFPNG